MERNRLITEQTYTVISPVSEKLQVFSLQPSLELALLLSELVEPLKLQPVNVRSTYETQEEDTFGILASEWGRQ